MLTIYLKIIISSTYLMKIRQLHMQYFIVKDEILRILSCILAEVYFLNILLF